MRILSVEVSNFRNYSQARFCPSEGLSVLVGDNAQGKTNLLEAIYLCCIGRSHRTNADLDLIMHGCDSAQISVRFERMGVRETIEIAFAKTEDGKLQRKIAINGLKIARVGEMMGHLHCVLFAPEHLRLIKDGPSERRRFLDMEISQLYPAYFYALQRYNRTLLNRNRLLKDMAKNPSLKNTLPIWDEQLCTYGAQIARQREEFLHKLSPLCKRYHARLSPAEEFSLSYKRTPDVSIDEYESAFKQALSSSWQEDMRRGTTQLGPHRDDIAFFINGFDIKSYASQGQQRSCTLSIKLAQMDIIKKQTGEMPILLLDDVLSELDEGRQRLLLENLDAGQTIVTCTDIHSPVLGKAFITRIQAGQMIG